MITSHNIQYSRFILFFVFVGHLFCFKQSLAQVITLVVEWSEIYGIHHWEPFTSSFWNSAWLRFEPTTTEFSSDALIDWFIRPLSSTHLQSQLCPALQFHLFVHCSRFIFSFAFISCHICFKWGFAQVIILLVEGTDTYGISQWIIFRSSYRKLIWVWFEATTTEFHSDAPTNWAVRPVGSAGSQSQLFTATPVSTLCSVFTFCFPLCLRHSPYLL